MDKLKMQTANKADDNFRKLAELFPNAVTEAIDENGNVVRAIDKDVLMQEISCKVVDGKEERYQFTWPDKKKSVLLANAPISATLRPCREESVNFDTTENLYIEGDNLDVLKLLQETYMGKIKMIYIDPPYNTGNDFVYNDDFAESAEEYLANSGQYDDQGNRLVPNFDTNGRFHTDWLNMIYPRIKLAKNVLSEEGVLFVSIDEHEIDNCLKVLDEIFGRCNRVGVVIIKSNPRGSMSIGEIANLHEYLIIYCKNYQQAKIIGHKLTEEMEIEYKYEDEKGAYRLLGLRMRGGFWRRSERPNLYFPIYVNPLNGLVSLTKSELYSEEAFPVQPSTNEDGTWRWSKEKISNSINHLVGKKVKRGSETVWDIFQKDYYDREGGRRTKAKSIWDSSEINYQNGSTEIRSLFGTNIFDYPKPVFLLTQIIQMIGFEEDDIILDFFSGSATTAHAVIEQNFQDLYDGKHARRKFILVQMPEKCAKSTEAYKAGYENICEIGKERIRRAGKSELYNIQGFAGNSLFWEERKKKEGDNYMGPEDVDIGFRVLKLDSSNMKDVYYTPDETTRTLFDSAIENIKEDRTDEDLLFQVMLELGVMLSSKIETTPIAGKQVFDVADGFLIACFEKGLTDEIITEIAKKKPYYFVTRDYSMASDSVATNFDQIFATYSPETVRKVL